MSTVVIVTLIWQQKNGRLFSIYLFKVGSMKKNGNLANINKVIEYASSSVHFQRAIARLFLLVGLRRQALAAYERAITLASGESELYVGKGNALFHLKRYEEALNAYGTASQLDPSSSKPYEGQAKVFEALAQEKYQYFMREAQKANNKAKDIKNW